MELIIKGFIIGIGKILPGVSGSMLAISLGIYEELIDKIANLRKNTFNNIKYITKIGTGITLAIILTSKIIVKCINNYYLPTMLLFVGLILGGTLKLKKKTQLKKINILIAILLISIIVKLLNKMTIHTHVIQYTPTEFIILTCMGIIDALTSIIPGISGTAILMTLGYYNVLIKSFASIMDFRHIKNNIFILIPFILGFIIGIITMAKIINKLLIKNKNIISTIILILMSSTILFIIKNIFEKGIRLTEFIPGILLFITGLSISKRLENMNIKK